MRIKSLVDTYLPRKYLLTIFTAALIVRIVCMVFLRSWELPNQWEFGYEIGKIGRSLAEDHGFSISNVPTAKYPPVYPYLVGGVFAVFGVYSKAAAVILFLFQSVCAAFTGVFLTVLGSRFFGRREGIIAGLIWAFYPGSLFFSVKYVWYSEFSIMLLLLLIIIATTVGQLYLFLRIVCLGLLSGILILTNSTMAIYPVLLILLMLYVWKVGLWRWAGLVVIWCAAIGIVVAGWGGRNYLVLGTPGLLKSNFGLELFFGNNPYSSGGGIDKEREQALEALDKQEYDYYRAQSEFVYYGYLQHKAFEWIRAHPSKFLRLTAKRFWYFWGKFPSSGPGRWSRWSCVQLIWYIPLALLALYGFFYSLSLKRNLVFIWLFLLVYPLPYYVTHVQLYRYRYLVEPFIVLLAAIPLSILLTRFFGEVKRK
jgi:hypothetical protein